MKETFLKKELRTETKGPGEERGFLGFRSFLERSTMESAIREVRSESRAESFQVEAGVRVWRLGLGFGSGWNSPG